LDGVSVLRRVKFAHKIQGVSIMSKAWVLILAMFAAGTCSAAPMVLKCNATPDGPFVYTLTVELEAKWMRFGQFGTYQIVGLTERYITGFEEGDKHVGGQIWVLDRDTGEYWRASVGLGWSTLTNDQLNGTASKPPPTMNQNTYSGKCNRPI
jgi:hypothetical protein